MALTDNEIKIHRRYHALRALDGLLQPAQLLPGGDLTLEFYQVAADMIGRNTPIRYLEFGVWRGRSMVQMARLFSSEQAEFFGFDSFEGLPEDWEYHKRGKFSEEGAMPKFGDPRIRFVKGWFQNTLPGFLSQKSDWQDKTTLVHYDADIYSATLFVLSLLWSHVPEYYFIFDEFHYDEVLALQDFASAFPVKIEFFGKTNGPMRVFGKLARTEFSLA